MPRAHEEEDGAGEDAEGEGQQSQGASQTKRANQHVGGPLSSEWGVSTS